MRSGIGPGRRITDPTVYLSLAVLKGVQVESGFRPEAEWPLGDERMKRPRTVRELRESGHKVLPIREEMRKNLIRAMRSGEQLFPGIIGYENTVIPQLQNAILAGHDIIFLGERGQAKTRLTRSLVSLLDEEVPYIAGCEINDNPFAPVCRHCREKVGELGEEVELGWLPREQRYAEKLATPDTTIADLIGEVDPIKVAEGRYLADELTIHYGLIPRSNRGIFCINELPDLAERIQVGLFNILEERDIQIRGYKVRLPLDVYLVASANPEDYTSRGRIITPLKDRYGSEIRTHYPKTIEDEIRIVEQEKSNLGDDASVVFFPPFMKEIIAELTSQARHSPEVNQRSGVSVRVSICNYEVVAGNAMRRAIRLGEKEAVPRISDLPYVCASTFGKIELEMVEEGREEQLVDKLLQAALRSVFSRYFNVQDFSDFIDSFKEGIAVEVSEDMPSQSYVALARQVGNMQEVLAKLNLRESSAALASGVEFILEGLHLNRKLNKEKVGDKVVYRT